MFRFDDLLSEDYMMGFLMGKALNAPKPTEHTDESNMEMSEEDIRRVDAILTQEMDQNTINRLRQRDAQDSL